MYSTEEGLPPNAFRTEQKGYKQNQVRQRPKHTNNGSPTLVQIGPTRHPNTIQLLISSFPAKPRKTVACTCAFTTGSQHHCGLKASFERLAGSSLLRSQLGGLVGPFYNYGSAD